MRAVPSDPASNPAAEVHASDRDRYFATLFAPVSVRSCLFALHAFDLALTDVVQTTSETHLGLIRLAWWRDAVSGPPIAGQPLLAAIRDAGLDGDELARLAEAHMDWLEGGERPAGVLFEVGASLLGADADPSLELAAKTWSAGQDARGGHQPVSPVERRPGRVPARIRPLTALAVAARRDLAGKREPRGSAGRQLAMLRHMLTGRI